MTLLQLLGADCPFPAYERELMLFGRFVGSWDIDLRYRPLDGPGENRRGLPLRWQFSDIEQDSFYWRGYISHDSATTWHLEQEMRATRA